MEHPWLLPWGKSRCLPQPSMGVAGILSLPPRLPVSFVTKGLSCRLDSALGSSCSCHEPPLALHRRYAPPQGEGPALPACLLEVGLGESSLQPATGTLRH